MRRALLLAISLLLPIGALCAQESEPQEDIRWIRYEDGREILTEFCGQQLSICKAFGITVPPECLPAQEKKAVERKNNPKKRGRKPKDAPAPNKVTVVQC